MKEITKVVVDAMGGDNAPHEIIKGAVEAGAGVDGLDGLEGADHVPYCGSAARGERAVPVDEFESLFGDAAAGGSVQGGGEHARSDAVAELALDVRDVPAGDADRFAAHGLALSLPRFRCRPPPAVRVRRRLPHADHPRSCGANSFLTGGT